MTKLCCPQLSLISFYQNLNFSDQSLLVLELKRKRSNEKVGGHPFMTSTRRGRGSGSGGRMWTGEGGSNPHVDVHTEN